jgi:hypothetical protein
MSDSSYARRSNKSGAAYDPDISDSAGCDVPENPAASTGAFGFIAFQPRSVAKETTVMGIEDYPDFPRFSTAFYRA